MENPDNLLSSEERLNNSVKEMESTVKESFKTVTEGIAYFCNFWLRSSYL